MSAATTAASLRSGPGTNNEIVGKIPGGALVDAQGRLIGIAVAQFFGGHATFSMQQVLIGDLLVAGLVGLTLLIGSWAFERESILTRLT